MKVYWEGIVYRLVWNDLWKILFKWLEKFLRYIANLGDSNKNVNSSKKSIISYEFMYRFVLHKQKIKKCEDPEKQIKRSSNNLDYSNLKFIK